MLNAEQLLAAEMAASSLNTVSKKVTPGSNPWTKYVVFGGIVVLALAGAYYINKQEKEKHNEKRNG